MYISITRITIVLCWLSLFAFWGLKLFGGNLFEIVVENENFLKFTDAVQNTWLKYLFSFFTIFIGRYLTVCAICQKFTFRKWDLVIAIATILSIWAIVNFTQIDFLKMWFAYFLMFIYGLIYQKGWKRCFGLLGIALDLLFSTISMLARNIQPIVMSNYMISMILAIDLYIMYCLYYLYSNVVRIKKEIK